MNMTRHTLEFGVGQGIFYDIGTGFCYLCPSSREHMPKSWYYHLSWQMED